MLRDSPCRPIRLLAAGAACVVLSGCYYLHLAGGQMEMNRKREPIEDVIASPNTDATLRRRLELAARARDFAMSDLGLPDNGSYRTYADLGRRYVTWNLFAAPEFSVRPKEWCFPIAGCVGYRGYFDEARATKEAGKMRGKGYDVFVGPAIAYSTLGHLRDPVLNTMFGYGDSELAAFIFHELAHQAVYAPDDSDFNEAFATVVETEGLERWLAHEDRSADLDPAVMRERKATEFAKLRDSLTAGGQPVSGDFNNARLVAIATYERCVPALRTELDKVGNDLTAFYAAMTTLARDSAARAKICPSS
jgi:predicted aminopeptidase